MVAAGGRSASRSIAAAWAQEDPEGALAWAKTLPRGKRRDDALVAAMSFLSGSAPSVALETLPKLAQELLTDDPTGQRIVSQRLVEALSVRSLEGTHAWLEQVPASFRRSAWEEYAHQWGPHQPEAVIDYLMSQQMNSDQVTGVQTAMNHWARVAPEETAARVMTFRDPEMRQLATKNVVSVWREIDEMATREWLAELTDPNAKQAGEKALNEPA